MSSTEQETKKKKMVPYESDRRGDYSDTLEYEYHNYQVYKKIPWGQFAVIYLIVISLAVFSIIQAVSYVPRKLDRPYQEPLVIDKMGYFPNANELQAELEDLQERSGAYFAIASIPEEEYETPFENGGGYYVHDVYHAYFDDEDHILIYIVYNGYHYTVSARAGENAKSIIAHIPLAKTISSRIASEDSIPDAFLDTFGELNPIFMTIQFPFYLYCAVIAICIAFIIWHAYNFIIKRRRTEKAEAMDPVEEQRVYEGR